METRVRLTVVPRGVTAAVNTTQTLTRATFCLAEFHEQAGRAGPGEDGNQEVQLQEQGAPGGELRGPGHTQQQLHVRLRHLPGEVHRRGGNGGGRAGPRGDEPRTGRTEPARTGPRALPTALWDEG